MCPVICSPGTSWIRAGVLNSLFLFKNKNDKEFHGLDAQVKSSFLPIFLLPPFAVWGYVCYLLVLEQENDAHASLSDLIHQPAPFGFKILICILFFFN